MCIRNALLPALWMSVAASVSLFPSAAFAQSAALAQGAQDSNPPNASQFPLVSAESLQAMQFAVERYRRIAGAGGWPAIETGPQLRLGESDERVLVLRRRLAIEGIPTPAVGGTYFDGRVEEALKTFQERRGLRASGVLNSETIQALNIPAAARLVQLERSVERLAELVPLTQTGPYVLVNVPSFEMQVIARGQVALYSRVIVGKIATRTPSLRATIQAVDLMPYWHVRQGSHRGQSFPRSKRIRII